MLQKQLTIQINIKNYDTYAYFRSLQLIGAQDTIPPNKGSNTLNNNITLLRSAILENVFSNIFKRCVVVAYSGKVSNQDEIFTEYYDALEKYITAKKDDTSNEIQIAIDYLRKFKTEFFTEWFYLYYGHQLAEMLLTSMPNLTNIKKLLTTLSRCSEDLRQFSVAIEKNIEPEYVSSSWFRIRLPQYISYSLPEFVVLQNNKEVLSYLKTLNVNIFKSLRAENDPLIFLSITNDSYDITHFYLDLPDIDINDIDKNGNTILHCMVNHFSKSSDKNYLLQLIEKVLKNPVAQVNKCNQNGDTSFYLALKQMNKPLVNLFLKNKCDIFFKKTDGESVLDLALHLWAHQWEWPMRFMCQHYAAEIFMRLLQDKKESVAVQIAAKLGGDTFKNVTYQTDAHHTAMISLLKSRSRYIADEDRKIADLITGGEKKTFTLMEVAKICNFHKLLNQFKKNEKKSSEKKEEKKENPIFRPQQTSASKNEDNNPYSLLIDTESWVNGLSTVFCGGINPDNIIWNIDSNCFEINIDHHLTMRHKKTKQDKMVDKNFITKQVISRLEKMLKHEARIEKVDYDKGIALTIYPKENSLLKVDIRKVHEEIQQQLSAVLVLVNRQEQENELVKAEDKLEKRPLKTLKENKNIEQESDKPKSDKVFREILTEITGKENLFDSENVRGFLKSIHAMKKNRWKYSYSDIEKSSISTMAMPIAISKYLEVLRDVCNAYFMKKNAKYANEKVISIYTDNNGAVIVFNITCFEGLTIEDKQTLQKEFLLNLQNNDTCEEASFPIPLKTTAEQDNDVIKKINIFISQVTFDNLYFHWNAIQKIDNINALNDKNNEQVCWAAYLFHVKRIFLILNHMKGLQNTKDFFDVRTIIRHAFDELNAAEFYNDFKFILNKINELFIENKEYKNQFFSVHIAGRNVLIIEDELKLFSDIISKWKEKFDFRIKERMLGSKYKTVEENYNAIEIYRTAIIEFQRSDFQMDEMIKTAASLFCYSLIAESAKNMQDTSNEFCDEILNFVNEVYRVFGHAEVNENARNLICKYMQRPEFYCKENRQNPSLT